MTKEERRQIAVKHNAEMQKLPIPESKVYSGELKSKIKILPITTEKAIELCNTPCVLNFASYTNPGGGFLNGSMAQEEALCYVSNLYNALIEYQDEYEYNKKHKNNGLYRDWAIYTKDVSFNGKFANVITCPAPNYKAYKASGYFNESEYKSTLFNRIEYILKIAQDNNEKHLILGAFGCGVFGNNPELVATTFKQALGKMKFDTVMFAIPEGPNLDAFKKVFNEVC